MTVRSRPLLVGLFGLLLASLLAAWLLVDVDSLKASLLSQVEEQIGRKLEVGQVRFSIFPRIRLDLTDVVIRDVDPARVFFKAKQIHLILRSTPLIHFRLVIKRLYLDQPILEVRRNAAGRWNVAQAASESGADEGMAGANPVAVLFAIQETTVLNGEVAVYDELRPQDPRRLLVRVNEAKVWKAAKEAMPSVTVTAEIPAPQGQASLSLKGQFTKGQAAGTARALTSLPEYAGLQFQGEVDLLGLDLRQMAEFFSPRPIPEQVRGLAGLHGEVTFLPGLNGYDLLLKNFRAEAGPLALAGQASVSGVMAEQPTFSLTVASSPVSLDALLAHFPVQWLDARILPMLTDYQVQGKVQAVNATVTGAVLPETPTTVIGEFRLSEGHAIVGPDKVPVERVMAKVAVAPDRVDISEVSGTYGPLAVDGGSAAITFPEGNPWLEMDVPGTLTARDLAGVLPSYVDAPAVTTFLAGLTEIRGEARLLLKLGGPLSGQGRLTFRNGEIVGQALAFRSNVFPEPIEDLAGLVRFTPRAVEFSAVRGLVGRNLFSLNGAIDFEQAPAYRAFTVETKADAQFLVQLLTRQGQPSGYIRGPVRGSVVLAGLLASPSIRASLDLSEANIEAPGWFQKASGVSATADLEATVPRRGGLRVAQLTVQAPPLVVAGKGLLQFEPKFKIDASVALRPSVLAGMPKGLALGGLTAGSLEISLDLKGQGPDWKVWQYGGWIAVTDGQFETAALETPLRGIFLRAHIVPQGADLKRLSFRMRDSDVQLMGTIRQWPKKPVMEFTAESAQFDLDLVIPKGARAPIRDVMEDLAATGRLKATLAIQRGLYKHVTLRGLSGTLSIGAGSVSLESLKGQAGDGTLEIALICRLPKGKPASLSMSYRMQGVPVRTVLDLLDDQDRVIDGALFSAGTVRGSGADPHGVMHSLQGHLTIDMRQGHIQRGTVLPKILSLLNVPALLQGKVNLSKDGFPYDKGTATIDIKDGVATVRDLFIDSPIMKVSAAGELNLVTQEVDLVQAVSPLGSYSNLIDSIPLFGRLFAGERQGLLTAMFEVKGPLKDPTVTYLPIRSVASGLTGLASLAVDVLKNAASLPKELIAPKPAPPSGGEDSGQKLPPLVPPPETAPVPVPAP